jgi:alkanesulfonate monooxygenase SsuD/methylene tetrahydromethanopterin reductase-like flavin-dependent oxidoreductase (luciferase family)
MNEGVEALRFLFKEDPASYHGRFIEFNGVEFYPKPVQKPFPIYLGRHITSDNVLKWLAKKGQGWIPGLTPEQFREAVPRLALYLKENGRKLGEIDIVREISLSQADTLGKAVDKYKNSPAQAHMNSLSKGKNLVDFDEEMRYSLIGTPDDIIKGIEAYLDVGVTHFMFNLTVRKPDELFDGIRDFSEKVMPSFN